MLWCEEPMRFIESETRGLAKKSRGKLTTTPKLSTLPPTTEVFHLNALRAHYQACIWNHCMIPDPPELNPCRYGWEKDETNGCLNPIMFPGGVSGGVFMQLHF